MQKARAEAFSDGVLAVAITLLALDLRVEAGGEQSLVHQLGQNWPSFAAYLVSFFVIGVIWVNHHALFALVNRVDRVLLFENLVLLMFVTTLPFTTATMADFLREGGSNARWAVVLYGISNIGMAFGFTAMLSRMVGHGLLVHPVPRDVGRRAVRRFGLGTIAYPVATVAGLLWPPLILIAIGLLALYYMAEQTPILPPEPVR
ncbi:MAG TPA: TMEM175 family protein [Jatrophihabitans sp.]|nr:TMEM175 family protein [Jatrophihabitans sp.]